MHCHSLLAVKVAFRVSQPFAGNLLLLASAFFILSFSACFWGVLIQYTVVVYYILLSTPKVFSVSANLAPGGGNKKIKVKK